LIKVTLEKDNSVMGKKYPQKEIFSHWILVSGEFPFWIYSQDHRQVSQPIKIVNILAIDIMH
jgi:hypothetical protein